MIVIAEHELMNTEHKFAIFQGIPVQEANKIKQHKVQKSNMVKPEDIKGKLKQWRILFYIDTVRDIDMTKLLRIKDVDKSLFIQIKMYDYYTKFEIKMPKNFDKATKILREQLQNNDSKRLLKARTEKPSHIKTKFDILLSKSSTGSVTDEDDINNHMTEWNRKMSFKLNKLRVHYFFTEFYEISKFLKNTKIELRITNGDDWNNVLAVGAIAPFYDMNPEKYDMVQTEFIKVPFLSQHVDEFYLNMK
jgi:hypothetical protein